MVATAAGGALERLVQVPAIASSRDMVNSALAEQYVLQGDSGQGGAWFPLSRQPRRTGDAFQSTEAGSGGTRPEPDESSSFLGSGGSTRTRRMTGRKRGMIEKRMARSQKSST